MELSEDHTELRSLVEGHASLIDGQVFVSDVYIVPANVDNSTGNIEYSGSVEIKGNVNSGFTVEAGGNITVGGIVEGATLKAGGDIVVARGIHGMSKALLQAGKSVTVKFIENAEVYSDESINTDSILHSNVSAKYEVRVQGKKGFISGGKIRAGSKVLTQTLGSEMGASTRIEVGVSTAMKKKAHDLGEKQKELEAEQGKMEPTITGIGKKVAEGMVLPEEKMVFLKSVAKAYQDVKKQLLEVAKEKAKLDEEMEIAENASIVVKGDLYSGCLVTISGAQRSITDKYSCTKLVKDGADVRFTSV